MSVNKNAKFMREFREFAKAITPEGELVPSNDIREQVSMKVYTNGTISINYPGISGVVTVYGSAKNASRSWQDSFHVSVAKDYVARELTRARRDVLHANEVNIERTISGRVTTNASLNRQWLAFTPDELTTAQTPPQPTSPDYSYLRQRLNALAEGRRTMAESPAHPGDTITVDVSAAENRIPPSRGNTITWGPPARWGQVEQDFPSTVQGSGPMPIEPPEPTQRASGYYGRLVASNNNWFRNAQTGESE